MIMKNLFFLSNFYQNKMHTVMKLALFGLFCLPAALACKDNFLFHFKIQNPEVQEFYAEMRIKSHLDNVLNLSSKHSSEKSLSENRWQLKLSLRPQTILIL